MARKTRLHVRGGLYHVTLRGNHRQPIFFEGTDRAALESFVADAAPRHGARLHAYCWMTNHIHLLVQVGEDPLGHLMQAIGSRYARFVQRRADTTGHLFERRYHAVLVDSARYLLALVRYVHLNPVRGGLVLDPDDYAWSSHRCYLGWEQRPWLRTDLALGMLASDPTDARIAYREFVASASGQTLASPLTTRAQDDPRVLGDEDFVRRLPIAIAPMRRNLTLDELIAATCNEFGVSRQVVQSASRARGINRVRIAILERALECRVANCSEVARRLGRSTAAISQSARRARQRPRERSSIPRPEVECVQSQDLETLKR